MCFQVCVCGLEVKESRRGPATGALSLSDVDEVISQDLKPAPRRPNVDQWRVRTRRLIKRVGLGNHCARVATE